MLLRSDVENMGRMLAIESGGIREDAHIPSRGALLKNRLMLIGQAPSENGDPSLPLTGIAGKKLAELLGISWFTYLRRTHRENIFRDFQGKEGKGDRFPIDDARRRARRIRIPDDVVLVLLLGKSVAEAFGIKRPTYFEPLYAWGDPAGKIGGEPARMIEIRVIPHPSGISRWWNDPENQKRAKRELSKIARSVWD